MRNLRLKASFPNLFVYAASAPVDSAILGGHNDLNGTFALDVTGKPGHFRDNNYDLE